MSRTFLNPCRYPKMVWSNGTFSILFVISINALPYHTNRLETLIKCYLPVSAKLYIYMYIYNSFDVKYAAKSFERNGHTVILNIDIRVSVNLSGKRKEENFHLCNSNR